MSASDSLLRAELDANVPAWLATHHVPSIALAYIDNGAIAWTKVYGEQSPGVRATPQTLYNVASLTKPIFAEVMLRAVAANRLALDERLSAYWVDPDVAADPRSELLTPRLALSHRTGFPNWRGSSPLRFEIDPGTRYQYSGEGFQYLARFAERKLGMTLDSMGREFVFAPYGMTSTAFTKQSWFANRVAVPRGPLDSAGVPEFSSVGNPADLLYTTIGDYAAFVVGVMNREGLPSNIARQRDSIHSPDVNELAKCRAKLGASCADRMGYGLGWTIVEYPGVTVRWHTGADWGNKSMVFYFAEQRRGVVMLTNGANGFLPMIEVASLLARGTPFLAYLRSGGN